VLVSDQDLEDAVFNLEQEILDNCTEQFAKAEGAAFVNGSSQGQPEGILTNASITNDIQGTGGGSVLLAQGLLNIWQNLKTVYAKQATWLMNRSTIGACRALADTQGRFLWEPGLADGTPPNLLGSPYIEVPDMPNIAANAFPIVYGNIKRGYLIVDRINVVVRRLQEKYAESGQIAYLVRKRVGGQVVLPEAIRKLKISVS
jgi:HK97 family phage major capsid protein